MTDEDVASGMTDKSTERGTTGRLYVDCTFTDAQRAADYANAKRREGREVIARTIREGVHVVTVRS